MKNIAASCMVVTTLIAAVMFSSVFLPPGGLNEQTGMLMFLGIRVFRVFAMSNPLSFFSSSTSMLLFLGIEEDLLKELPTKLGIGIFSLFFFSVITMMTASGAALFIILHVRFSWVAIPISVFALIPCRSLCSAGISPVFHDGHSHVRAWHLQRGNEL